MAINLLPKKVHKAKKRFAAKQTSIFGTLALLIGVAAVSLGVFAFRMVLAQEIKGLEDGISEQKEKIIAQEEIEMMARGLEEKVQALDEILGSAKHYSVLLEGLSASLPKEIALNTLRADSAALAGVSGTALSYVDLARFLEVVAEDADGLFSGVKLKSVSLDSQTGQVKFDLDLIIGKEALRGQF